MYPVDRLCSVAGTVNTYRRGTGLTSVPVPPIDAVHVTIIYDNYQADASLETDWGFACLVEYQGNQLAF